MIVKRVADIIKGDKTDRQPKSAPKNLQEGHDDIANLFNNRKVGSQQQLNLTILHRSQFIIRVFPARNVDFPRLPLPEQKL